MEILAFVAEALGDSSYLLVDGPSAAVTDPQRDVRPYVAAAAARNARIEFVFETHVHNDYLSGGRELAALGARVVAPRAGQLEFPHLPVGDSDTVDVGGARLVTVAAPGHTYEHVAYLVQERSTVRGAFTGGAILMAAVGRSDLLGPDHTGELLRMQWATAGRLRALLPPDASVMPTHGAGSFCSTTGACLERIGPLSVELERNPAFVHPTFDAFRAFQMASSAPIPAYYRYMAPLNRRGPAVFGKLPVAPVFAGSQLREAVAIGAVVVDARPRKAFAAGHIAGAYSIEDDASFLAYVSWLVPFNAPIVLVALDAAQAERLTIDLFRIGYEDVRGWLPLDAWDGARAQLQAVEAADVAAALAAGMPVVDVRFEDEQAALPVPGAIRRPIDQIVDWREAAPEKALVFCASGYRSAVAASFLAAGGKQARPLLAGGASEVLEALANR